MSPRHLDSLRIAPGSSLSLRHHPTGGSLGTDKESALAELDEIRERLDVLQQRLAAESQRSLLLVLQAMDAAGKDGTIRAILSGLNPAGVQVTSFKAPAENEAAHDFLWRVHAATPARGDIGIFNRSHYEDVLVVRVKNYAPKAVWSKRFDHINAFEQLLVDEGTTVVKCFLHVSKDVQRTRLQERVDDPEKRWKFRAGDLDDRSLWSKYQQAYQDAIQRTSTAEAPWYVVPADHNWERNLAVARILLHHLETMKPRIPKAADGIEGLRVV